MELVFGYIDPGSGSLIIQALIAGLVAVPIFFRSQIARLLRSLGGRGDPGTGEAARTDDASREA